MQQIIEPNKYILSFLGKQQYSADVDYRFLNFCFILKYDGVVLLYNNFTKEFFVLTNDEFNLLEASGFKEPIDVVKTLVEQWFLVYKGHNDLELCSQIRAILGSVKKKGIFKYTILPTTGCNARCFYCFEAGVPVVTMSKRIAEDVARFIVKHHNNETVEINWFGGEPLCNPIAIDTICRILKENNVKFISGIITNGYLFDEKIVKSAKEIWNLQKAQITLDGLSDTYNRVKAYANGDQNAFDRVLSNIELLAKNETHVSIRLNIDNYNIKEMISLVNLIDERFIDYKKYISVYACPLYEDDARKDSIRSEMARTEITEGFLEVTNHIENLGFRTRTVDLTHFKCIQCQADCANSTLISADGHLGFCEHFVTDDFYGTIYDDVVKPKWSDYIVPEEKCKTCVAFPNCVLQKKCPDKPNICPEYNQLMRIMALKNGVKGYYERYKKTQAEKLLC